MNYSKLDASLSAAISQYAASGDSTFQVSVRTLVPPSPEQQRELESLGVHGVSSRSRVFSAELSSSAVSELSEKPWVRLLTLSQVLRPLG
jgi:hypothetical protein